MRSQSEGFLSSRKDDQIREVIILESVPIPLRRYDSRKASAKER